MVPCIECNADISKEARSCPRCGKPLRRGLPLWLYLGAGALFLTALGFGMTNIVKQPQPIYLESRLTKFNCSANNTGIDCAFTNISARPIVTCLIGTIRKTGASGVGLSSMPLCSGPIAPFETRNVSAHWTGGFAKDLCNTKLGDTEILDWTKCDFNTADYDLK